MQVILTQRIEKLGNIGDVVTVKNGYARNYLLPTGRAVHATKDNAAEFEQQKEALKQQDKQKQEDANKTAKELHDTIVSVVRMAGEAGHLFGSVTARDVADALSKATPHKVKHSQVRIVKPFKVVGMHNVEVYFYGDTKTTVFVNIARTEEESNVQIEKFKNGELQVISEG